MAFSDTVSHIVSKATWTLPCSLIVRSQSYGVMAGQITFEVTCWHCHPRE